MIKKNPIRIFYQIRAEVLQNYASIYLQKSCFEDDKHSLFIFLLTQSGFAFDVISISLTLLLNNISDYSYITIYHIQMKNYLEIRNLST